MSKRRVVIMGAAGRDFHNFNVVFRDNSHYEVVAFTATQIPNIAGRKYPAELAGQNYPDGIPIVDEENLETLIREKDVDEVVFAYSDISHQYLMERGSRVLAAGADFHLIGPNETMLKSTKPVVSVCAVRTGCGKSQTTRYVADVLQNAGFKVAVIRHPMPYGDLVAQKVQRYETLDDLDRYRCTIEEREEFEPHIRKGLTVYAGVDYQAILYQAEADAEIILWDGGNNDWPFYRSDLEIVVVDPHRAGHETSYFPGMVNFLRGDIVVINKVDTASLEDIQRIRESIRRWNPKAMVVDAASPIFVENSSAIRQKRVLVIEDGPTLTHGGMVFGAGIVAAGKFAAGEIIDPRPYAVGSLVEVYRKYDHIQQVLPAMGYGEKQVQELAETIRACPVDTVIMATPVDLRRLMEIPYEVSRVTYELQPLGQPSLDTLIRNKIDSWRTH